MNIALKGRRRFHRRSAGAVLFALLLFSLSGCRSTEPGEQALASVLISGNTPGQISDAAVDVFNAHGYKTIESSPYNLVFDKPGGHMDNFTYGSWLGDDPIWLRVKATIQPAGSMVFRLQCSAFVIKDRGGSTEEQRNLGRTHKGPYQKLLDEVAAHFARPSMPTEH